MCCSSAVILLAGLHLVGIPCLPSFSSLVNISYMLPIRPHSPCWPLLLRIARLSSLPLTFIRTCAINTVLGSTGLLLIRVAHLLSFSLLAYISFALLVCHHSPRWPISHSRCSSGLILLADLHLVGVPHLLSFSSPDNISYALSIWPHSPCWPLLLCLARLTSLPLTYIWTCTRNAELGITGLHHLRVACLVSFSSLTCVS